jgi:hypothetical protein
VNLMNATTEPLNPGLYRLHRIFFIAIGAFAVIMLVMGGAMLFTHPKDAGVGLTGLIFLPIGALHWYAAAGARDGTASGKVISRIIGTLWLVGFPLGTFLGIYVWVKTSSDRWRSDEDVAQSPAANLQ